MDCWLRAHFPLKMFETYILDRTTAELSLLQYIWYFGLDLSFEKK